MNITWLISLSAILLNSRDWSEIVWLPEISRNFAGMHWLGYNDAVSWLNEAKTQIFLPTANFENFEIRLYFVCQPAVRPGCTRCRAPEISHDKGNHGRRIYENVVLKTIYPLPHGDSFYPSFSFLVLLYSFSKV